MEPPYPLLSFWRNVEIQILGVAVGRLKEIELVFDCLRVDILTDCGRDALVCVKCCLWHFVLVWTDFLRKIHILTILQVLFKVVRQLCRFKSKVRLSLEICTCFIESEPTWILIQSLIFDNSNLWEGSSFGQLKAFANQRSLVAEYSCHLRNSRCEVSQLS